jgi:hypothetical protein
MNYWIYKLDRLPPSGKFVWVHVPDSDIPRLAYVDADFAFQTAETAVGAEGMRAEYYSDSMYWFPLLPPDLR